MMPQIIAHTPLTNVASVVNFNQKVVKMILANNSDELLKYGLNLI